MGRNLSPIDDAQVILFGLPVIVGVVGALLVKDLVVSRRNTHLILTTSANLGDWAFDYELFRAANCGHSQTIGSTIKDLWRKGYLDRSMRTVMDPRTGYWEYQYKINKRGLAHIGRLTECDHYEPLSPRGSIARKLEQVLRVLRDLDDEVSARQVHEILGGCSGLCTTKDLLKNLVQQKLVREYWHIDHDTRERVLTYRINVWGLGWLTQNCSS